MDVAAVGQVYSARVQFHCQVSRRRSQDLAVMRFTTIKRMTWRHAWNVLPAEIPSVRHHAGSGRYSVEDTG